MSNYLIHYGILGQKWGIRKYQNPDGSLTSAGRARYQKMEERNDKNVTKSWNKTLKSDDDKVRKNTNKTNKAYEKLSNAQEGTKKYDRLKLKAEDSERRLNAALQNKERDKALKGMDLEIAKVSTMKELKKTLSYEKKVENGKTIANKLLVKPAINTAVNGSILAGQAAISVLTGGLATPLFAAVDSAAIGAVATSKVAKAATAPVKAAGKAILNKPKRYTSKVYANDYDEVRKALGHSDDGPYLSHWGIFGMKWGIRRYQNKDGSLTEAGKLRYLNPTTKEGNALNTQLESEYGYDSKSVSARRHEHYKNASEEDKKNWTKLKDDKGKDAGYYDEKFEKELADEVAGAHDQKLGTTSNYMFKQQYYKDEANAYGNGSKALVSADTATMNASNTLKEIKKAMNNSNETVTYRYKGEEPSSYSDEELRKIINRIQMENTYNSLTTEQHEVMGEGQKKANEIIDNVSRGLAIAGGVAATAASVAAIVSNVYKIAGRGNSGGKS